MGRKGIYYKKRQGGPGGRRPAQDELLAFIKAELAAGRQPSLEAMRGHMDWKKINSVKDCLRTITGRGELPEGFDRSLLSSAPNRKPHLERRPGWDSPRHASSQFVETWEDRKRRRARERAA